MTSASGEICLDVSKSTNYEFRPFQWPRVLRHGSATARFWGMRIRIPPVAWLSVPCEWCVLSGRGRLRLKCNGTRAETRFRLSAKRTSPFKSAGGLVQSTAGSRGVRNSGSNAGYTMFRGSVKGTGYPLHSSVSPSLPLPCVTVCHHISTGLSLRRADPKSRGVLPSVSVSLLVIS